MSAQLLPNVFQQFRDSNGNPLAGGKLYSYAAGTTTPQATYTDETAGTPNTNPIILDASGSANVWLGSSAYKFILKDSSDNIIWTVDNVSIINPASIGKAKLASDIAGIAMSQAGDGSLNVNYDNSTIGVSGNNLYVKDGGITQAKISTSAMQEVVLKNARDYSNPGTIQSIPQVDWTAPTAIADPAIGVSGGTESARWSPNGEFVAVASNLSPFIQIYQRSGDVLTKLTDPGTLPTGIANDVEWSPCGDFLAVAHNTSPFVTIYQRSGVTFTKLSNPGTLPPAAGQKVRFSPNSDYLFVATSASFILYKRSGTTFTDITSTSTITGIEAIGAWSPDSTLLAGLNSSNTGHVDIYQRVEDVFSLIHTLDLSASLTVVKDVAFSPDGQFFAACGAFTPFVAIYAVSSAYAFTLQSNPANLPPDASYTVAWSINSQYLFVGHDTSPYETIYQVSGSTFTKQVAFVSPPHGRVTVAHWSPTKQYLSLSDGGFFTTYKTASTFPTSSIIWTRSINV